LSRKEWVGTINKLIGTHRLKWKKMDEDHLNQTNEKWIKSGDLIIDLSSFQNGFQKEVKRYRQEIWDYMQYRESLVRWPIANEKIKMGVSLNHG
jgi:hypothetical protein